LNILSSKIKKNLSIFPPGGYFFGKISIEKKKMLKTAWPLRPSIYRGGSRISS
jgi:hypothetical protein